MNDDIVSDNLVSQSFRRSTYFLVILTFFLMLLGGYVKAVDAGLSCPDWPLCYDSLFPFLDGNIYPFPAWMIFAEWFHRLIAVFSGFYMIFILYKSNQYKDTFPILFSLSRIGLILFITQGLFGGLTVLRKLNPFIVVAHLGNALLIIVLEMILAFYATVYSGMFDLPIKK